MINIQTFSNYNLPINQNK